jgi:hypothetical protein
MNTYSDGLQFLKIPYSQLEAKQTYYIFYKYVINNYWIYPIYGTFKHLDENNALFTNVKQEGNNITVDISEYKNDSDIGYNYTDYEFYINLQAAKAYQLNNIKDNKSLKQELIFYTKIPV